MRHTTSISTALGRFLDAGTGAYAWFLIDRMQANIDLNFLYFMMATATCCGVPPLAAAVAWSKTPGWGAVTGPARPQGCDPPKTHHHSSSCSMLRLAHVIFAARQAQCATPKM